MDVFERMLWLVQDERSSWRLLRCCLGSFFFFRLQQAQTGPSHLASTVAETSTIRSTVTYNWRGLRLVASEVVRRSK
jgi:hypothetical protein